MQHEESSKHMGFFDMTKPNGTGFARIPNKQDFTNQDLLNKLSAVKVTFGTPVMGSIGDYEAVLYEHVSLKYDLFVRVDGKNIIAGKIGSEGVSSVHAAADFTVGTFMGYKDENQSDADHAVDELAEVLVSLENGEDITESRVSASMKTSTGRAIEFYMKQKAISLKPKFDMFDENEAVVYHVEGDLTRLNYSIRRDGGEVLKLKKKAVAVPPEYVISAGGKEIGKIKKKIKLTNPELKGTLNGQDVHIEGNLMGSDFDIRVGSLTIGRIDTSCQIWNDVYRVMVFDESYKDIMAAMTIICDRVVDAEREWQS